ncbi:MAG: hypothetical protein C5B47_07200 [Verrucomicrobia bacterium]|nr:MAG: hypothetical protein C5B47_07200 [Verrucomicrobiota bacterium]
MNRLNDHFSPPSLTSQTVRGETCGATSVTLGKCRTASPALRQIETSQTTNHFSAGLFPASPAPKELTSPGTPILLEIPEKLHPPRRGAHCKISALALFDAYHTEATNIRNVPLLALKRDVISIRRISKKHHSVQGEVLQRQDLCNIAKDIGYDAEVIQCKDITQFGNTIYECLKKNNPPLVVFPVDSDGGPRIAKEPSELCEHGALITGFNPQTLEVTLAHWGKTFGKIPLWKLYASMQSLLPRRLQEIYLLKYKNDKTRALHNPIPTKYEGYKYPDIFDMVGRMGTVYQSDDYRDENLRESMIPKKGTGFKNCLFVFTPNPESERWVTTSPEKQIENIQPFSISADVRKRASSDLKNALYEAHPRNINNQRAKSIVASILSAYNEDRFVSPSVLRGFEEKCKSFDSQMTYLEKTELANRKTPKQLAAFKRIINELVDQLFADPLTPAVESPLFLQWLQENGHDATYRDWLATQSSAASRNCLLEHVMAT